MRVVRASLKDLPEAVRKSGLTPLGIIAVGEVCAFHFTSMVPGVLESRSSHGTEAVGGRTPAACPMRVRRRSAPGIGRGEGNHGTAGSGVCGPFPLQMGDFYEPECSPDLL